METQRMPEPAALRDFARRYTAAWCSQDAASVAAFFSLTGSLQINDAAPASGRDAIQAAVQSFMTAFPNMQVLMDEISVEGDRAIYRWTLTGANTGPGGTGHRVRFSGHEKWSFGADGLIAESQGHFDAAEYQRQIERGIDEPR
jgi:predicted ester cyclase